MDRDDPDRHQNRMLFFVSETFHPSKNFTIIRSQHLELSAIFAKFPYSAVVRNSAKIPCLHPDPDHNQNQLLLNKIVDRRPFELSCRQRQSDSITTLGEIVMSLADVTTRMLRMPFPSWQSNPESRHDVPTIATPKACRRGKSGRI